MITFNILFILSLSLTLSSSSIMKSQTVGRNYKYEVTFKKYQTNIKELPATALPYLKSDIHIKRDRHRMFYHLVGLPKSNQLFRLLDKNGHTLNMSDGLILNPELKENYGLKEGDTIQLNVKGKTYKRKVVAFADNADLNTIYLSKAEVAHMLGQTIKSYNGVFTNRTLEGGHAIAFSKKIGIVKREQTSNKASAVLNQVIGLVSACLLIYLAIFIGLSNNLTNVLIFDLLGYDSREINRILLTPYINISNVLFVLTLPLGVFIAKKIQMMTSIQTGDYMPFQVHLLTFVYMLIVLNLLCIMIKMIFKRKIKRIIKTEQQSKFLMEW